MGSRKLLSGTLKEKGTIAGFIFLEVLVFVFLFSFFPWDVLAGVGENNVTVTTTLTVGNVAPEILNVTVNGGSSIDLTPNGTTNVEVFVIARDFDGEDTIQNVTVRFFDIENSSYGASDDNNNHYTNNTCLINTAYGDQYEVNATCNIPVQYYANNATWNASVEVIDNTSRTGNGSDFETVNLLLALALPDSIDFGTVNSTEVSEERNATVTNAGNSEFNLSLSGYARTVGDGFAMNCSVGTLENISIGYEKYNITASHSGFMNLTDFDRNYTNLTSNVVTRRFDLDYRQDDSSQGIDDFNTTYWRIYVPVGAAGVCSGNIVFGAIRS